MRKSIPLLLSLLLSAPAFAAADRVVDTGVLQFKNKASAPATPSAGYVKTYGSTDGFRYFLNSSGTQSRILDTASFGTNGQLWRTTGSALGLTSSTFPSTNAAGDTFYGSGSNAWGTLSIGTANQLYGVNAAGTAPEYKSVTATSAGALTAPGAIRSNTSLILEDPGAGSNTITIQASTPSAGSYTLKLPTADGTSGQAILTDGAGNLSFGNPSAGVNIRSEVQVHTRNGYGSTNTMIPRFTTTLRNVGSAITYADTSTDGASFTINEDGIYSIYFQLHATSGASPNQAGISVNSNQLTTVVNSISYSRSNGVLMRVPFASNASEGIALASWTGFLNSGDVIRPHTRGEASDQQNLWNFGIVKIAN